MELVSALRRAAAQGLAMLGLSLVPASSGAADAESLEYSVKAAYLTKFGVYVEWPSSAFAASGATFGLCIVGEDPFGAMLDAAANGQRIDGRAIVIRRLKTVARDAACHILYVGGADAQRAAQIVESVRGSAMLTVSDVRNNAAANGVINFVVKDNRVRFNIDEEAAAQNGLSISSKLLGLALSVKSKTSKENR